ncbi:MAG: BrnA antitoxin family protein [bacterium]
MRKLREVPKLKNEAEEREFWAKQDSTAFINWNKGEFASFPNLRPTMKKISLRLPEFVVNELRSMAKKRDVSYQSLIKIFIKEKIDQEHSQRVSP